MPIRGTRLLLCEIVGLHENLFEAMMLAAKNAINFLVQTQGFTAQDSYQFLSIVGILEFSYGQPSTKRNPIC